MPPRQSARSTPIISSKRLPRVANSTPSWSNSSRIQPAPQPSATRLREQRSVPSVATPGIPQRSTKMMVEKCSWSQAAIAAIEVQTSGNRRAIEARLAVRRIRIPGVELLREEEMVGEQGAVEASLLCGPRQGDELLGVGEGEDLPELHAPFFSAG
jgi:hypothetical protein